METKLKESQTSTIVTTFGFDLYFAIPPIGTRGGLLFLWRLNILVHILGFNHNMLSVFVYPDLP